MCPLYLIGPINFLPDNFKHAFFYLYSVNSGV